jgi:hypothetical protein
MRISLLLASISASALLGCTTPPMPDGSTKVTISPAQLLKSPQAAVIDPPIQRNNPNFYTNGTALVLAEHRQALNATPRGVFALSNACGYAILHATMSGQELRADEIDECARNYQSLAGNAKQQEIQSSPELAKLSWGGADREQIKTAFSNFANTVIRDLKGKNQFFVRARVGIRWFDQQAKAYVADIGYGAHSVSRGNNIALKYLPDPFLLTGTADDYRNVEAVKNRYGYFICNLYMTGSAKTKKSGGNIDRLLVMDIDRFDCFDDSGKIKLTGNK